MDVRQPALARFFPLDAQGPAALPVLPMVFPVLAQPELPLDIEPPLAEAISTDGSPLARQMATSITTALVEVIAGRRTPVQLDGWVESDVMRLVERLRFRHSGRDLRLCSLRLQFPVPDVAEVCARLSLDGYGRAAALRIGRRPGGWWVTSLTIALPAGVVSRAGRS